MPPRRELCFWNQAMDDALVDAYLHQHRQGNRVGGTFTSYALDKIEAELKEKFPDKGIDKEKIKNRNKIIKNKWSKCFDLFSNGGSGFAWNPLTNMWIAEPEVWETLIQAKPEAAECRQKPFHNYEKMVEIYGRDRATGEHAETAQEIRRRTIAVDSGFSNVMDENDDMLQCNDLSVEDNVAMDGDRTESPMGIPTHSQNANPGTSRKRKNRADDGEDVIRDGLQKVAEAIINSTAMLVKPHPISEEEIYNHLVELGLEGSKLYESYLFLVRRPDEVKALFGAPINVRKDMLEFMMSSKE